MPPSNSSGGILARVLPESPPTPEVRDLAKSMLKASGVRLVDAAKSERPAGGEDFNPLN